MTPRLRASFTSTTPQRLPARRLPARPGARASPALAIRPLPEPDYAALTPEPKINVACLWPEFFNAMLNGEKDCEWRQRHRLDPVLEQVREGEVVIFYESRSPRCLSTLIWEIQKEIHWSDTVVEYALYLDTDVDPPVLLPCAWPDAFRPQGWSRWTRRQLQARGVAI